MNDTTKRQADETITAALLEARSHAAATGAKDLHALLGDALDGHLATKDVPMFAPLPAPPMGRIRHRILKWIAWRILP